MYAPRQISPLSLREKRGLGFALPGPLLLAVPRASPPRVIYSGAFIVALLEYRRCLAPELEQLVEVES